ncbi:hypothetical protein E2542_SST06077 [Spatholobus suberectus]|nr:hypothetical protein E2542_SST06077 [Spatholobus suberectus]
MLLQGPQQRMLFRALALVPHLYFGVRGARVDNAVVGQNQGVYCVLVRVFYGLQTLEIRGSPDFECPVPRGRVKEGAVSGKRESGDGVHVMHPRALLVPPNLDVVLGGEELGEAVVERGERGCAFVIYCAPGFGFPDADFVVLVGGEQNIVGNDEGLDGRVAGCGDNVGVGRGGFEGEGVSAACSYFAAGGGAVEGLAVEGEGGDGEVWALTVVTSWWCVGWSVWWGCGVREGTEGRLGCEEREDDEVDDSE